MNLKGFENKLNKINPIDVFFSIADNMSKEFLTANKDQLMEGKTIFGKDIRPYYSEDNYFKSPASAERYRKWKEKITPNPKRNPDAPNLFITGKFHDGFYIKRDGHNFIIDSNDKNTFKIKSKFKNIFGLMQENILKFKNILLKRSWIEIIKKII